MFKPSRRTTLLFMVSASTAMPFALTAQAETPDHLRFGFAGTRTATRLYWTVDATGKGEIAAQLPLGFSVANTETGIGDYRFAEGLHAFDIGRDGYVTLKGDFENIIAGRVEQPAVDLKCLRTLDLGSRVLSWVQDSKPGSFMLHADCESEAVTALAEQLDGGWQRLARLLLRQNHAAVSETMADGSAITRDPLTLAYEEKNIWTGNTMTWDIMPDGKGRLSTTKPIRLGSDLLNQPYFEAGEYRFDVGAAGYLSIRRELDAVILGPLGKGECISDISDQPLARLTWKNASTGSEGTYRTDLGCRPFASHIYWPSALIGDAAAAAQK
jgi:hypothetical protein